MGKGTKSALISNAGQASGQAKTIAGQLTPQLQAEAAKPQGYTPQQLAYMNTASQQSLGGGTAATTGQANLTAARTRNAGGFQGAVGTANRATQRQASQNALQVQENQANLQEQEKQSALKALQELYGTNLTGSNQALSAAGQTPNEWNNLLNATVSAVGQAAGARAKGCWIAAAHFGEDFATGIRTNRVRDWLWSTWAKHWYAKPVLALYAKFGKRLAGSRWIVKLCGPWLDRALEKADGRNF
jgi:hypothetical protein